MAAYRLALEIDPRLTEGHCRIGMLLQQRGQLQDASGFLEQARALDPQDADIHVRLGNISLRRAGWMPRPSLITRPHAQAAR